MKTATWLPPAAILLAVSLALLAGALPFREDGPRRLPAISLPLVSGGMRDLAAAHGPVLVNFWSLTCPSCLRDMPEFAAFARETRPSGLDIVAIAMPYDPPDRVLAFARDRELPFAVAFDLHARAVEAFGNVAGTPAWFLFDRDGRLAYRHIGPVDFRRLRERVDALADMR